MEPGSAGYVRLFDIKIVDKDDPNIRYQPAEGKTVDVRIEMDDVEDGKDLSVVHFADGSETGDVVDSVEVDGNSVNFEAEGFSVYAVVEGSTDENARMKVEFWNTAIADDPETEENDERLIATMYVKNKDTSEELEYILYDPGAGTLTSGELFTGWIMDKENYTSEDIAGAMTIDDVRDWAESKEIHEGETHKFYASICRLYHVIVNDKYFFTLNKNLSDDSVSHKRPK